MNSKKIFLNLLILTIVSCQSIEKNENLVFQNEFGKSENHNDNLNVELNIKKFSNWNELIEKVRRITCNDSIPKISLRTENIMKAVYIQNPCFENFGCILIKEKNVIEIHNNKIRKNFGDYYSLDSLDNFIERDYYNKGKNPSLSESPEKLLFQITYDGEEFENFEKTLIKLIESFERITNETRIRIWLNEYFEIPPPPPIPTDYEIE